MRTLGILVKLRTRFGFESWTFLGKPTTVAEPPVTKCPAFRRPPSLKRSQTLHNQRGINIKKIYENKFYRIYEIPEDEEDEHQYKMFVKEEHLQAKTQIDREIYASIEKGLEYAKESVEDYIQNHFTPKKS